MTGTLHATAFAAALAALALAAPARAEPLAVKTGLWQVTSTSSGIPKAAMPTIPPDQLAKLTPQQQAMLQQRMAAVGAGGAPTVQKVCVTQAMLEKGFAGPATNRNCTRTVVSSSASALEVDVECTGDHPATGTYKLQAADAETVSGSVDMTMVTKDGQSFPMHRTMQSKWLGADCGSVKPAE